MALGGEGLLLWPTVFSVGLFPVIVTANYVLARSGERKVEEEFGEFCRKYRRRVPMFIPLWGLSHIMVTTREET